MTQFPAAGACAELLLADRKDAVYEGEVKNLVRELLERCCGTHVLSQVLPELTSVSALLYYLLVLGRKKPQQTLGEEYCDVMRVAVGTTPMSKNVPVVQNVVWARHLAWIAVAVLPKYIASRSQTGWLNLSQLTWSPRERMAQQLRQRQAAEAANGSSAGGAVVPPQQSSARSLLSSIDRLVAQLKAFMAAIETKILPTGYEFSFAPLQNWLSQVHLALFYISAKYLHVAKRVAGIEYVFVRKDMHPALNLSLLGYVMMIRLVTTSLSEMKRVRKLQQADAKLKIDSRLASQGAVLTARVPTGLSSSTHTSDALASSKSKKKCALCLGERVSPATTPCGHVFCWECIVGWCQKNKPECPICRQEAHPQQIKCIYNYN